MLTVLSLVLQMRQAASAAVQATITATPHAAGLLPARMTNDLELSTALLGCVRRQRTPVSTVRHGLGVGQMLLRYSGLLIPLRNSLAF